MSNTEACPCGLAGSYVRCCGRFIELAAPAQSAELLMRSRYSAYVRANRAYLLKSWHPDTRPELDQSELDQGQWIKLEILTVKPGLKKSIVEFKAYYLEAGVQRCLHETSLFKKVKQRWYYFEALANS